MNQFRKNGFTILEVLIAVGLVSGLALAIIQFQKNTSVTQAGASNTSDVIALKSELEKVLLREDDCTASLKGVTFNGATIQATPKDTELWYGDQDSNRSRKFLNTIAPDNKYGKLIVKKIQFSMPDYTAGENFPQGTNQSFKIELRVEGEQKVLQKANAFSPIAKTIDVIFDTDSSGLSTITRCGQATAAASTSTLQCYSIRRYERIDFGHGFIETNGTVVTSKDGINVSDVTQLHSGCCLGGTSADISNTRLSHIPLSGDGSNVHQYFGIECREENGWKMFGCAHASKDDGADNDTFMNANGCWSGDNDGSRENNSIDIRCCRMN